MEDKREWKKELIEEIKNTSIAGTTDVSIKIYLNGELIGINSY